MTDDYKSKGEWKIQITMRIIFISFIDKNKTQVMHTKSDNVKIMNDTDTSDATNELIDSFMKKYQEGLETKMKGSNYIFERIDLLEYHLHKISLNRGSSYIQSDEWIRNKGVTVNAKNKDNKCFQYAITAALSHQNINHNPERISNLKPFTDNYSWKDIEFPSTSKGWRIFERNNKTIALNILFVPYKKNTSKQNTKKANNRQDNTKKANNKQDNTKKQNNERDNTKEIRQAYISKYNNERDNQVNLLMIIDGTTNWHYLAIKNLSGLLRGITSNHNGDFYCLNCLYSIERKVNLKNMKIYLKITIFAI